MVCEYAAPSLLVGDAVLIVRLAPDVRNSLIFGVHHYFALKEQRGTTVYFGSGLKRNGGLGTVFGCGGGCSFCGCCGIHVNSSGT